MNFKDFIPAVVIATLIFSACSTALYLPSDMDAKASMIPLDSLMKGRKLYINKCSSCHNLYLPEKYTTAGWDTLLPRMQERAKISNSEINIIKKYLFVKPGKKE